MGDVRREATPYTTELEPTDDEKLRHTDQTMDDSCDDKFASIDTSDDNSNTYNCKYNGKDNLTDRNNGTERSKETKVDTVLNKDHSENRNKSSIDYVLGKCSYLGSHDNTSDPITRDHVCKDKDIQSSETIPKDTEAIAANSDTIPKDNSDHMFTLKLTDPLSDEEEVHVKRKSPTEKARLSDERRKQIDVYKESVTREERELRYKRRLNGDPVSSPAKSLGSGDSGQESSPRKMKRVAFESDKKRR